MKTETIKRGAGEYAFTSPGAKEKIATIMAFITKMELTASKAIANELGLHPTTTCTYLTGMHRQGLITPVKDSRGNGLSWKMGRDPHLDDGESKFGRPIVRQVKAADVKEAIPVDPMNAFLFGARRSA